MHPTSAFEESKATWCMALQTQRSGACRRCRFCPCAVCLARTRRAHPERNMELDKNQDTTMTSVVAISSASPTTLGFNFLPGFYLPISDCKNPFHPCTTLVLNLKSIVPTVIQKKDDGTAISCLKCARTIRMWRLRTAQRKQARGAFYARAEPRDESAKSFSSRTNAVFVPLRLDFFDQSPCQLFSHDPTEHCSGCAGPYV